MDRSLLQQFKTEVTCIWTEAAKWSFADSQRTKARIIHTHFSVDLHGFNLSSAGKYYARLWSLKGEERGDHAGPSQTKTDWLYSEPVPSVMLAMVLWSSVFAISLALSTGGDVAVDVFDINQRSLPTPFIQFLCLFLFVWPFQLYFIP